MADPLETATAFEEDAEEVEDPDPQSKANKEKKRNWKKAPLTEFWEPAPYVLERKGQGGQSSGSGAAGQKSSSKGSKAEEGGHKGGKGREKGRKRDDNGGKGKQGVGGPDRDENPDSDYVLPRRGEGAYVPPRPAANAGEEGFEDRPNRKGWREGGKRGGRTFDGKGGKGSRFNSSGDGCGRNSGRTKGHSYGSASDMQGTNLNRSRPGAFVVIQGQEWPMQSGPVVGGPHGNASAQAMPTERMLGKGGGAVPVPAFCSAMPLGATMFSSVGPGGKGVSAFPAASMPFAAGYNAMPCNGNSSMPATYALPYFMMPATVAGCPNVSIAATTGMAAPSAGVAIAMSTQDGGAGSLPPNMEGIPILTSADVDTSGDGDLTSKVMKQIEYYFSTENLLKDMYLRIHMNEEGWVPIGFIAIFPSLKKLTADQAMIVEAIASSDIVEVDPTKTRVRVKEHWGRWLLNAAGM